MKKNLVACRASVRRLHLLSHHEGHHLDVGSGCLSNLPDGKRQPNRANDRLNAFLPHDHCRRDDMGGRQSHTPHH